MLNLKHVSTIATLLALAAAEKAQPKAGSAPTMRSSMPTREPRPGLAPVHSER